MARVVTKLEKPPCFMSRRSHEYLVVFQPAVQFVHERRVVPTWENAFIVEKLEQAVPSTLDEIQHVTVVGERD